MIGTQKIATLNKYYPKYCNQEWISKQGACKKKF
uniref:Uncharacterized protein n=1 Tax=Rhizophora mucronata TaxID=61149 RepID=A0A2P2MWL6_RHIMU